MKNLILFAVGALYGIALTKVGKDIRREYWKKIDAAVKSPQIDWKELNGRMLEK